MGLVSETLQGGFCTDTFNTLNPGFLKMKEIKLNRGFIALVDDEDYEYLNQFNWSVAQRGRTNYAQRSMKIDSKWQPVLMHKFILNPIPFYVTDHKDRDGLNNQKSNLRLCTRGQNSLNSDYRRGELPKHRGVSRDKRCYKKPYRTRINVGGKEIWGGRFKTEDEAAKKFNELAVKYFGEFAKLNDV